MDKKLESNIKRAIELETTIAGLKRELDSVKASIQEVGLQDIDDRNVKTVSYYTPFGEVIVSETQSLDLLNVKRLRKYFEGVWDTKVTEEKPAVKYKLDKNFERALKAIFTKDYTFECSLEEFLDHMSVKPDEKQKALLLKKLKGDFVKDRALLNSVLGEKESGFYDVDLWYVYKIKNAELIESYTSTRDEDELEKIRKCVMVATKTGMTLNYDKEN